MNKFLTSMLNFFNIVWAIVVLVVGAVIFKDATGSPIWGIFLGFVLSVISTGSIALLIIIKDELVTANEHLKKLSEKK